MIEIGKTFWEGLERAKQTTRTQRRTNTALAQQAEQQALQAAQAYEQNMDYLFRSAAEKTQQAYANARQQLTALQAQRAAKGISSHSASAQEQKQAALLQQTLQENNTQQALQQAASAQTQDFQTQWKQWLAKAANYRKQAQQKSRLGSVGQALANLWK